jgi:hypothetical protein
MLKGTQFGNTLTGTLTECGKDAPESRSSIESEHYKIAYPSNLFDQSYLPSAAVTAALSDASPEGTFALATTALLMGATMVDPINGVWPNSAAGLTQTDMDADGKPGVSVNYLNTGGYAYPPTSESFLHNHADTGYVASRIVFSLNGALTSCTQSTGSALVPHLDGRVFGCSRSGSTQDCNSTEEDFLDNNNVNYQADTATYTLVKIADFADCADVRATLP